MNNFNPTPTSRPHRWLFHAREATPQHGASAPTFDLRLPPSGVFGRRTDRQPPPHNPRSRQLTSRDKPFIFLRGLRHLRVSTDSFMEHIHADCRPS